MLPAQALVADTAAMRWATLTTEVSPLLTKSEDYSRWTLPYICPPSGISTSTELQGHKDSIGAAGVNHLANKLIMTLFQPSQPFMRLSVDMKTIADLEEAAKNGDQDAITILDMMDKRLADAEKSAMRLLGYNRFRTEATMAAKHLIITGNACMYVPLKPGSRTQVYGLNDYRIVRDLSGIMIELMTMDKKAFHTFSNEVQDQLRANESFMKSVGANKLDQYNVDLYTWIKLDPDGRYSMTQWAGPVKLDSTGTWTADMLPWIPLTWNLVRGENYGRGLVEDYAGAFRSLDILTEAYITLVGIAADIKFLVAPTSLADPVKLNSSPSGTYHAGNKDDVTAVMIDKVQDTQIIVQAIQNYQQQIGKAFLLNSVIRRDAERVTAEEIRADINELDLAHGGIYSRFAEDWQQHLATLLLKAVGINLGKNGEIYPQIITGLDSLSRAGDLDNLRLYISDLQMLDAVPEDIRMAIDPIRFSEYVGIRRGVDYTKFTKTVDQLMAEQQAQQAQMEAQMDAQASAGVATEMGKTAVKGEI